MRDSFVNTLIEIAKENKNIELITGDLGFGVLKPFWEQLPDQFTNAGISEQNMTALAAGMAMEGKTVFVYSIGNFPTLRCLEQIRNDCAYHKANVKIVSVGAGFVYGPLGMSHHSTEDISVLRAIPNVSVFSPCDPVEAIAVTKAIVEYPGTCYMRLGRGGELRIHDSIERYQVGNAIKIINGSKIAFFITGAVYNLVKQACTILNIEDQVFPAVYTFPTIKPIDKDTILNCASQYELIVTIEEHNIVGGFGSAVAEVVAEMKQPRAQILRIGVNDQYASIAGSQDFLRNQFGLSVPNIVDRVRASLNE